MSTTKVINHLSVDNLNLNEVLSQQDKFFVNDDLILIFNGNDSGFLFLVRKKFTRW